MTLVLQDDGGTVPEPRSKVKLLKVSYEYVSHLLTRDIPGKRDANLVVRRALHGLPGDAQLSAVALDPVNRLVIFRVHSNCFDSIATGEFIPEVTVSMEERVPEPAELAAMVCRTLLFHQDDLALWVIGRLRELGYSGAESQDVAHGAKAALRTLAKVLKLDVKGG